MNTSGELGNLMGVWGHPDDEAYLSAGLMMRALEAGHHVTCVTATKGEAGFPDDDPRTPAERMTVRESEMAGCLAVLGVTDHRWLGYGDGRCAEVPDEEASARLAEIIIEVRPDTVLTFGPDGVTGHPDHVAACRWATRAVELAGLTDTQLLYSTKTRRWNDEYYAGVDLSTVMMVEGLEAEGVDESELAVWFSCDDQLWPRKVAALRAQASQIDPFIEMIGLDRYVELVREEFFRHPRPTDPEFIERTTRAGRA